MGNNKLNEKIGNKNNRIFETIDNIDHIKENIKYPLVKNKKCNKNRRGKENEKNKRR